MGICRTLRRHSLRLSTPHAASFCERPCANPLRRWFSGSIFSTKEADTWWHPPSDEFEKEDNITGHIECATKGADPDRNFLSVDRHKAEVKKGVVTVTEVGEGEPSMDITTWMYDK